MFKKINIFMAIFGILGVISVSGCVSNQNPSTNNSSHNMTDIISINNSTFNPNNTTVTVRTDVRWVNNDKITHRVVSDNGTFDSGNLLPTNIYSYTFNKIGIYPYHDAIHPTEKGIIIVE